MQNNVTAITLELTEQCNLRCDYCFTHGKRNESMNLETIKKSIDWLIEQSGDSKKIDVTFWGGEPLMGLEMIKAAVVYIKEQTKKAGKMYALNMTTNGTLLSHETLKYLKQEKINFSVSVDGREEVHDSHRPFSSGKGSYRTVEKCIKRALEYFPKLNLRLSLTADNGYMLAEDVIYFYKEWGVINFNFSPVWEHEWTEDKLQMMEDQFRILSEFVFEEMNKGNAILIYPFQYGIERITQHRKRFPCGAGRHYLGISTEGALYPCHRFHKFSDTRPWQEQEFCIGHIEEGITQTELREKFYGYSLESNPKCQECNIKELCLGHCYASCLDIGGSIQCFNDAMCHWNKLSIQAGTFLYLNLNDNDLFRKTYVKLNNALNKRNGACNCNSGCYSDNGCECYNACYSDFYSF